MTIHKSKGLQFPVVVLADASRKPRGARESAFLLQELGLSFKLDPEPMLYRLAKVLDKRQSDAEEHRVLYVALTRAQEKLIINGHVTGEEEKGWKSAAWLDELCAAVSVDVNAIIGRAGEEVLARTLNGHAVRCWTLSPESQLEKEEVAAEKQLPVEPDVTPIFAPLTIKPVLEISSEEAPQARDWRVTGKLTLIPPGVVGSMVHKAIELWLFPGDPHLFPLLETAALDAGLAVKVHRDAAVNEAMELLSRLQTHPIRAEIEAAKQVYHELPYTRLAGDHAETGYIDLLYRGDAGWQILDFKTDAIRDADHRAQLVEEYASQLQRYVDVVEGMLGESVTARLCFLDDRGEVGLTIVIST